MRTTENRPRFLNLLQIRMPIGAVASIAHRISGVLLFLILPAAVFLLELSVRSPEGFDQARAILHAPLVQLLGLVLAWALLHHLLAGIRFLLLDLEIGIERKQARVSAWLVNLGAPLLLLLVLGAML
jgi:succinate dehydrogenase / fumarate reductase cytochrome b subunit